MTEEAEVVLRGEKNASIISALCELYDLNIETATDLFYSSSIANLVEDKIADLHCRSDKYLATLIMEET